MRAQRRSNGRYAAELTSRQRQRIAHLRFAGLSVRQIGRRVGCSFGHAAHVARDLGAEPDIELQETVLDLLAYGRTPERVAAMTSLSPEAVQVIIDRQRTRSGQEPSP